MVSRVGMAAAAMCAAGGMTLLWTEANRPATVQADETWTDTIVTPTPSASVTPTPTPVPSRHETPTPGSVEVPRTYAAGEGDPRGDWARCVVHALVTPGMGGDADMTDCDDAYYWAAGESVSVPGLWLWCPGAPEDGGCEARDGWEYPQPVSEEVTEEPEYAPGQEPEVLPTPEPSTIAPSVEPDTTPVP